MQTFSILREQAAAFYKRLEEERIKYPDGSGWETMTMNKINEVHQNEFPDFPLDGDSNFIIAGPFHGQPYGSWEYSLEEAQKGLEFLQNPMNRIKSIIWFAILRAYSEIENRPYGAGSNNFAMYARTMGGDEELENNPMYVLRLLSEVRPSEEHFRRSQDQYRNLLRSIQQTVERSETKTDGLTKILTEGPTGGLEWKIAMEEQLAKLIEQLPSNGLASRTWGFEIESPDCKGVNPLPGSGIDKGDDGSLRSYESSDECDCCCRDCTYHECDCDNCDQYNDSPDHCNDSDCSTAESAEYRSTGGIQRVKHNGMYKLCEDLTNEEAEMNDSAGTHIHVWGQDLTTHQVGQVMASYKRLENLFGVLCGRSDVQYARKVAIEHIRGAIKEKNPTLVADKPRAVNVAQLMGGRGTIEFRQMDCNYDADRITLFAWIVRGLVETAKRGATLQSFFKVTDFYDLVVVFGKYNYFIANETPELTVPGSKVDMNVVDKVAHRS